MRTRIIRGLTQAEADQKKIQYEAMGWTVVITPEGEGKFQLKATKDP